MFGQQCITNVIKYYEPCTANEMSINNILRLKALLYVTLKMDKLIQGVKRQQTTTDNVHWLQSKVTPSPYKGCETNTVTNIREHNNKINTGPHLQHSWNQNLVFLSLTIQYHHPVSYKLLKNMMMREVTETMM